MKSLKKELEDLVIDSYILSKQSTYHQGINDAYMKLYLRLYGFEERSKLLKRAIEKAKKENYFPGRDWSEEILDSDGHNLNLLMCY